MPFGPPGLLLCIACSIGDHTRWGVRFGDQSGSVTERRLRILTYRPPPFAWGYAGLIAERAAVEDAELSFHVPQIAPLWLQLGPYPLVPERQAHEPRGRRIVGYSGVNRDPDASRSRAVTQSALRDDQVVAQTQGLGREKAVAGDETSSPPIPSVPPTCRTPRQ